LTPKEKAAILLISLGREYASELYKFLSEEEISDITLQITTTSRIPSDTRESVINEFYELCLTQNFVTEGGIDYARELLKEAIGEEKAEEMLMRISASLVVRPFQFLKRVQAVQVFNVIRNEQPQVVALILSYADPKQAAEIISMLEPERQMDIVTRIAIMGSPVSEYVQEAERFIENKLMTMGFSENINVGGIDSIVEIINSLDRASEKNILQSLDTNNAELADEIRKRLFVFEDIIKLDNRSIQMILRDVNNTDLVYALKTAAPEVATKIFSNISQRQQEMIKDDMEVMGPVRVRDVEEAQQRIVNVIRKLEEDGNIQIVRGDSEELIV
jgi:flagellar motor switch protein FliG